MTRLVRCLLGVAVLLPSAHLLADDGSVRVAVVVDMTPEGRKAVHPTPNQPVYYLPVVLGFKQLGGVLKYYQRPPPPPDEVQSLLAKTLADQGYRVATKESPPSLVLVFRWGYIAPVIVMGQWENRDEMMTYLAGDNWRDLAGSTAPEAQELISGIDAASGSSPASGPYGHPDLAAPSTGTAVPSNFEDSTNSSTDLKSRYFLLVSALDFQAFRQNRSVLLWREHVSINYWGHYLDEALPTLIAAGASGFGRETNRPQMTAAPIVPLGHVIVGTPTVAKYFQGVPTAPVTVNSDRIQADTDKTLRLFADQGEEAMMGPPDSPATPDTPPGVPEAPRREQLSEGTVRLPPYIVTDTRSNVRWHYATVPGFEILSCCSTADTERFAEGIYRQQEWLNQMVPPGLQARRSGPTTFILLNDDVEKGMARDIAILTHPNGGSTNGRPGDAGDRSAPQSTLVPLPQVQLSDEDSLGADIIFKFQPAMILEFDPDYVFFQLTKRAPSLPAWFNAGMMGLYRDRVAADAAGVNTGTLLSGGRKLFFLPATWISPAVTELVRPPPSFWTYSKRLPLTRALLPMRDILMEPMPQAATDDEKLLWFLNLGLETTGTPNRDQPDARERLIVAHGAEKDSPWRREIWTAQTVLFMRWALDDQNFRRREALWKFADRASVEPVTEAMFKDCFGLDFAEMDQQLIDYLPIAASEELTFIPQAPLENPWVEPREPTESEKAQILGDWQRKEIDFVKPSHPEYAEKYATQARLTLMHAYNDGAHDPGLLAAIGLYECTMGDDDRARGFLEAAVQAHVARPRAYVELARIRLIALLERPAADGDKLSAAQVASALDLLQAARSLQPPQLATYLLAAEAWKNAAVAPAPDDLSMLDEGLHFFPDEPRLIVATAQLDARAGLKPSAIRVLDRGLQRVSDPAIRHLFATLRAQYGEAAKN